MPLIHTVFKFQIQIVIPIINIFFSSKNPRNLSIVDKNKVLVCIFIFTREIFEEFIDMYKLNMPKTIKMFTSTSAMSYFAQYLFNSFVVSKIPLKICNDALN